MTVERTRVQRVRDHVVQGQETAKPRQEKMVSNRQRPRWELELLKEEPFLLLMEQMAERRSSQPAHPPKEAPQFQWRPPRPPLRSCLNSMGTSQVRSGHDQTTVPGSLGSELMSGYHGMVTAWSSVNCRR